MNKILEKINQIGKDRWLLLLVGGLLIIIISIPTNKSGKEAGEIEKTSESYGNNRTIAEKSTQYEEYEYAGYLENRFKKILQKMDGVGSVDVFVTLSDVGSEVVEKDKSSKCTKEADHLNSMAMDTEVETDEQTIYAKDAQNNDIPFVSKRILPKVEGILIVAEGANDYVIKNEMKSVVLSLFDLDEHKISIVKMKQKK